MASLMPNGKQQFFNSSGAPLAGGKVYTYAAGTTTNKATYTTAAAAVQNANPVVLDSRGEAAIFWNGSYAVVVKDASDNLIYSIDNYVTDAASTLRADLAASTGASLIGWIQSGTGAVARTQQDKSREIVSVKDFGAKGDGSTNDTAAIQLVADAVRLAGGGRIYFPAGTYIVTQTVLIGSNTTIYGDGAASIIKASQSAFAGTNASDNCYLISNYNKSALSLTDSNITVQDLAFDYGTVTIAGGGAHHVRFRMVTGVRVIDCNFSKGENATAMLACKDTLVQGCRSYNFSNCGWDHWEAPKDARVIGCYAETAATNQMINFNPENSAGAGSGTADGFIFSGNELVYTGASAIGCSLEPLTNLTAVKNLQIDNNKFSNCFLALRGAVSDCKISDNIFTNFSGSNWAIAASPLFANTPSNIVVADNEFINVATSLANLAVIVMHANGYSVVGNTTTGSSMYASLDVVGYSGVAIGNNFAIGTSGFDIVGTSHRPAWTNVTYSNSWVDFGAPYFGVSYYKDQFGIVHLRGCMKSGTMSANAFTLPAGYRPSSTIVFPCLSNSAIGAFQVQSGGGAAPVQGSNVSFFLDGISFRAD